MYHHLALAHALAQERLAQHAGSADDDRSARRGGRRSRAAGRELSRHPTLCPHKRPLAMNIQLVEHAARARVRRSTWLSRAYYGCCIPSGMLAAVATTSTLAHHPAIAGSCSAVAAAMTAALTCLRGPYERSVAERPFQARYETLVMRARELLNSAHDSSTAHLEASMERLETDLENLQLEEAGWVKPVERDSSRLMRGRPSRQASTPAESSSEGS